MGNNFKPVRKAVLPVAGMGTRFLPATKAMAKEMLTVLDKPLIQYAVEEGLAAGIEEFIFITGRGKAAIENHFDRPYELCSSLEKKGKLKELEMVQNIVPEHCRMIYTRQGDPLGLGHAVNCANHIVGDEPFAVILPDDIIYDENTPSLKEMIETYNKTGKSVVLTQEVPENRIKNYGILDTNGEKPDADGNIQVHGFVEKPNPEDAPSNMAVMGRYILTPSIFKHLEKGEIGAGGEIQLTDAMDKVLQEEGFYAHLFTGERFDCGDKFGFQQANLFFALKDDYVGPRLQAYIEEISGKASQMRAS